MDEMLEHIPRTSTEELNHMLSAIKSELSKREKDLLLIHNKSFKESKPSVDLPDLVKEVPNFCKDSVLLAAVRAECESLNLSNNRNKASTQWISPSSDPYIYPDSNPIHNAIDISGFAGISKALAMVNDDPNVDGPLDACLVIKYNSNSASLSLHADDEGDIIDQTKSICPLSLGSSRTLEFFTKTSKPRAVKEVRMDNNSLIIMKPGTQQRLLHCVRAEPKVSPDDVRYCLSFRALTKPTFNPDTSTPHPSKHNSSADTGVNSDTSTPLSTTPDTSIHHHSKHNTSARADTGVNLSLPTKHVCLIAGDSYAARLDPVKLGKNRVEIDNIAVGGAKIDAVCKQLEEYAEANPNTKVNKLCISVGTNDLRKCHNGVEHLKGPLKKLCVVIRQLYPNSKVFFQTLLPLPLKFEQDWKTNHTIWEFNRMIYNECIYRKFYIIDAFPYFTAERQWGKPHIIRFDPLFEENGIHPSNVVGGGMGILARLYLRALHSKYFNPYWYQ